jgi:hypothetical protein
MQLEDIATDVADGNAGRQFLNVPRSITKVALHLIGPKNPNGE